MKMKLTRIWPVLVTLTIWVNGCIREDIMLPPVLDPLSDSTMVSNKVITLTGNNFDPSTSLYLNDVKVDLAGTPSVTMLSFVVPYVPIRTESDLYVKTKFGATPTQRIVILPPAPDIDKIIPAKAGVNKKVKIVGEFLSSVTAVQFKSTTQTNFLNATITRTVKDTIEVIVPSGLLFDAADVVVETKSGKSDIEKFTVLRPPVIKLVNPTTAGVNMRVTLTGDYLSYVESVRIGTLAAEVLSGNESAIEIRIPDGASTDTLHVYTAGGKDKTDNKFVIIPSPSIASLDKWSGGVNTDINITGTNFAGAFEVKFGNTPASVITLNGAGTSIKTKVPAGAESGLISVTTPGGTAITIDQFYVLGSPLINSFSPTSGTIGTKITLTGFGLGDITSARIGVTALKINSKSDTKCEVEILAGSVTGKISVTAAGGSVETLNNFTVTGSPEVTSINPTSGNVGTIVTITGLNFPVSPIVKFTDNKQAVVF
jgi:hypothetical protein